MPKGTKQYAKYLKIDQIILPKRLLNLKKLLKMRKLKSWDLSQALRYAKSSELRNEILKIILKGKTNINLNYDFLTHFEKNAREQKMLELIKEKITTGGKKDKEIQEIIKNMETVAASRRKIKSA